MGLLDRLRGKTKSFDPRQWTNIFGGFSNPFSGLNSPQQRLNQYKGWVYACVQARAEAVGEIELGLYNADGEEITEHELLDLLNKLNPHTTKSDHFAGTQSYLDLLGDSYWFLARDKNGKGKVKEIYLLRPDRMKLLRSTDPSNPFMVKGYEWQNGAQKIPFEPNQILHIPNFNPMADHPFPYTGMSVIEAAATAIETDNEARQWNFSFFKNAARPDGFIVAEGTVDPAEEKRMKEMFNAEHRGSENAGKIGLLQGGTKFQEMTRTQKDMDFIEQRRFTRDEILALFRVPKTAIGIVEDVNRANAEATNYVFALRTVRPLMQRIVDHLNEFLVPEFGEGLYLDFKSPVPEDEVAEAAYYTQALDRWMTRNEIRELEGLEPTQEGDKIFGTLAQIPIDGVDEVTDNPAPAPPADEPPAASVKKDDKPFSIVIEGLKLQHKKEISKEVREKYIGLWKGLLDQNTRGVVKKVRGYFTDQEKEVQANLKREYGDKGLTKGIEDVLFDEVPAIRTGISLITPHLKEWLKQAGIQATEELLGSNVPFDPETVIAQRFLKARAQYFAKTINEKTREDLVRVLKEGTEAGEGLVDLSKRVADVYDGARDYRTDRIARTEVAAAANEGSTEAYKQAGVEKHEWLVVDPEDADCLDNAGEVVTIGDNFSSGVDKPPVHPNCVCTTIPVFD